MNGKGKMIYANGDIYDGEWSKNEKEGYGIESIVIMVLIILVFLKIMFTMVKVLIKLRLVIIMKVIGNLGKEIGVYISSIGDKYEGSWKNDEE